MRVWEFSHTRWLLFYFLQENGMEDMSKVSIEKILLEAENLVKLRKQLYIERDKISGLQTEIFRDLCMEEREIPMQIRRSQEQLETEIAQIQKMAQTLEEICYIYIKTEKTIIRCVERPAYKRKHLILVNKGLSHIDSLLRDINIS